MIFKKFTLTSLKTWTQLSFHSTAVHTVPSPVRKKAALTTHAIIIFSIKYSYKMGIYIKSQRKQHFPSPPQLLQNEFCPDFLP